MGAVGNLRIARLLYSRYINMSLLKFLANISPFRGLPVNNDIDSGSIRTQVNETVQLYYYNSGTLTADAGQAAGTLVVGRTKFANIRNAIGDAKGNSLDQSFTFTSSDLTSEVAIDWETLESVDGSSGTSRLQAICAGFTNGQYCIDYKTGTIYGKKASTGTTLTAASYKYAIQSDLHTRPATDAVAVTAHDTTKITGYPTRALYVGGTGNVTVLTEDGSTITFTAVPAGTLLPIAIQRVNSTNTTATSMTALL